MPEHFPLIQVLWLVVGSNEQDSARPSKRQKVGGIHGCQQPRPTVTSLLRASAKKVAARSPMRLRSSSTRASRHALPSTAALRSSVPVSASTANSSSAAEPDVQPSKHGSTLAQSTASSVEDEVDFPALLRRDSPPVSAACLCIVPSFRMISHL